MRDFFIEQLRQKALLDPHTLLITGDLGFGVMDRYRETVPHQFINAGVAEQNMTGIATGLALQGYRTFTYSIGNFSSLRCLEQIRNDVCYHNANVKIVSVGSGLSYGSLGMSHHATEDVAILRALPNIRIYSPADSLEVAAMVEELFVYDGPAYIRLGRSRPHINEDRSVHIYQCNPILPLADNAEGLILTHGTTKDLAYELKTKLPLSCQAYTIPCLKPLPTQALVQIFQNKRFIITIEEHNLAGGFGSAIGEILLDHHIPIPLLRFGLPDQFLSIGGTAEELSLHCGLDCTTLAKTISEKLSNTVLKKLS